MKHFMLLAAVAAIGLTPVAAYAGNHSSNKKGDHNMQTAQAEQVVQQDIVDIALADDNFSTLVAALQAADLVSALKGDGPFTVFAPTNDAFAKLPEGTVENLLMPENKAKLAKILTYHVVPGSVPSSAAAGKKVELDTLAGIKANVDGTNGVNIAGANVVSADIEASNGIIHVIDNVMLPQE
jgi:uncharacterized surface protein with fasciclin (FAS1) repeats